VSGLYVTFLNRSAGSGEVSFWVNALGSGESPAQVVQGIVTSPEFLTNFVRSEYQTILGRTGMASEVTFWVQRMEGGLNQETVEAAFLASPEFFQTHGNTNTGWLDSLYSVVLGRTPDTAGQATWQTQLQMGVARSTVAQSFVNSHEHHLSVVQTEYLAILQRQPDAAGQAFWTNNLDRGTTVSQLEIIFGSSPEYRARFGF
jgi:hypothetical protein